MKKCPEAVESFAVGQLPVRRQAKILLFFCVKKVAIAPVSGIITTNLGKTATPIKIAGREKTDTSLQNMPFSRTGEGHFLCPALFTWLILIFYKNQIIMILTSRIRGTRVHVADAFFSQALDGDGIPCDTGAK
jgi:hypothetical protein